MKARSFTPPIYRLLLWLHPLAFRKQFGDEMLWIFDLSAGLGQRGYLLYDGVRSAVLQHAAFDPQEVRASFLCLEVRTSRLTLARVGQAIALGGGLLLFAAFLVAREMPPVSVLNQKPTCQPTAAIKSSAHLEIWR
jgi:hypothetical protein